MASARSDGERDLLGRDGDVGVVRSENRAPGVERFARERLCLLQRSHVAEHGRKVAEAGRGCGVVPELLPSDRERLPVQRFGLVVVAAVSGVRAQVAQVGCDLLSASMSAAGNRH